MLGRPVTELISEEVKAEHSANAITAALELDPSEERDDIIERNARHLQIVLPSLDISATKRKQYEKLVADYLVE